MENDDQTQKLEVQEAFAYGQLAVAEDLGPLIAILVAIALHQFAGSWILTIGAFFLAWYLIVHPYSRAHERAQDAHHRAAGIGKYCEWMRGTGA